MKLYEMDGVELAIAIIPYQKYGEKYAPAEALQKGTMFPALYRPYTPEGRGMKL